MTAISITELLTVITAIASAVSAIASAVSAYKAHHSITAQKQISAIISVGNTAAELAEMLTDPGIMALHGISEADLKTDGLEPSQLSYLVKSFTMGETYYRVQGLDKSHIRISQYRRQMLANPVIQVAWKKYIKHPFFSSGPYGEAIDRCLAELS